MKRPKLEILESDDIRKIITAAYDLLENFGVMVDNEEALGILEDGGARVDVKKLPTFPAGWWTRLSKPDLPVLRFMIRNVDIRRYWKTTTFISRGHRPAGQVCPGLATGGQN